MEGKLFRIKAGVNNVGPFSHVRMSLNWEGTKTNDNGDSRRQVAGTHDLGSTIPGTSWDIRNPTTFLTLCNKILFWPSFLKQAAQPSKLMA